jgi:hypothetical protein
MDTRAAFLEAAIGVVKTHQRRTCDNLLPSRQCEVREQLLVSSPQEHEPGGSVSGILPP